LPKDEIQFEWDEANEVKLLLRHGVRAEEAEACFFNRPSVRRWKDVYLMLGQTSAGRLLFVVYERKPGQVVRIFSARDMKQGEKAAYRRQRGDHRER